MKKNKKIVAAVFAAALALALIMSVTALTACGDPTVTGITLDTSAVKTTFSEGDAFDYTGLKVIASMSDETTKELALSDCEISQPDTFAIGEKTVTVTYGEFTAEYKIEVIHKCTQQCPVCGNCLDMECEDPVCAVKCGDVDGYKSYTLEAENYNVNLKPGSRGAMFTLRVIDDPGVSQEIKDRNADVVYIGNFNESPGATIEFNVWSDRETTGTLFVSVCKRVISSIFTQGVVVMVNGEMLERNSYVPSTGTGTDTWTDFIDVNLGCISLIAGNNNIQLISILSDVGYNFDNIKIKTDATLGWTEDASDVILEDTDTSGYDGVVNMAYNKDYVLADVMADEMQTYGKDFTAYAGHLGGAEAEGETGRCFDGTKLNGQSFDFDFYMISKGTAYINMYMAAPAGYTADDLAANVEFTLDGAEISKENIFIASSGFVGRAGEEGVATPFVTVGIGANGAAYNDMTSGAHKLTVAFIGDNAPDLEAIAIQPLTLGQYYTYTALSVDASGAKTEYLMNEEFSYEGIVVTATKRDGSQEQIDLDRCAVYEPDMETMGTKLVTVTFEKVSASYSIDVKMDMEGYAQVAFEGEDPHVALGEGHMFGDPARPSMPNTAEGTHIGGLNACVGATVTFRIDGGETGGTAILFVSVCKRSSAITFSESMSVTVNDELFETTAVVSGTASGGDAWNEFETVNLGEITLKPGENVIVFTVLSEDERKGFNFDKIILAVEEDAGWTPAWYEAA